MKKPIINQSNSNIAVIEYLNSRHNKIHSCTGGWKPGKGVTSHGYSMLDELVGKKSYFQLLILNATGKLVDRALADWCEAVYSCLSWPDPRIWCNQIGALAGLTKSSVIAATAMGALAADSRFYGVLPILESMSFIKDSLEQYRLGKTAKQIVDEHVKANKGKLQIVGYKRPIAKGDERLEAMQKVASNLGFTDGKHLSLAYEIEQILLSEFDEGMNINGYVAAFLSDQNFKPQEVYQFSSLAVASGVTACYVDVLHQPENSFLPLRCDDMDYQGIAPRVVPET